MSVQPRSKLISVDQSEKLASERAAEFAQRRAWVCLWVAFGIWCLLVGWGLITANTWRKTAYISPPAQIISKRGIVLYQGPRNALPVSIAEFTDLEEGGIIEVPASAEAVIRLGVDGSTVHLRSGSRLRLATMRVGRFNRDLTQIQLEQLQGAANYQIVGALPDGREVEIKTPQTPGARDSIKLTKGDYLVWVQPKATRLIAYVGQARADVDGEVYRLRDGRWVALGDGLPEAKRVMELPEQLVRNRDFSRGLTLAWTPIDIGETGRPDVGGQRSIVNEEVNGELVPTLRITRDTAKDTHNETGLRQQIDREVSAYRSVTFSAWVKVNSASLDGGGYAGSEYPMMFRINYVAENGGNYTWAHGFYVKNETNRPADIGELIPAGQWHHFTLDMHQLPDRPAFISSIEVLASGHDFDAQVTKVELKVE